MGERQIFPRQTKSTLIKLKTGFVSTNVTDLCSNGLVLVRLSALQRLITFINDHVNVFVGSSHQIFFSCPFFEQLGITKYLTSLLFHLCNFFQKYISFFFQRLHLYSIGKYNLQVIIIKKENPHKPEHKRSCVEFS